MQNKSLKHTLQSFTAPDLAFTGRSPALASVGLSVSDCIKVFFSLTVTAKHSEARRDFWQDYCKHTYMELGLLLLSPSLAEKAEKEFCLSKTQFAELAKHKRMPEDYGVLLLRVHDCVIAESSHSGKCRIWLQDNAFAPKFFKKTYQYHELIDYPDYVQQHYFSSSGLWQRDLIAWLTNRSRRPSLNI